MTKSIYLFLLCILVISCSDDPEPDIRAQAVGDYSFTGKYYYISGSSLTTLGNDFDNHGTLSVAVDPNDANGILITDAADKTQVFKGSNLSKADEGFSFDLLVQELGDSNPPFMVQGYSGAALQAGILAKHYHGVYLSATNELIFYWQFKHTDSGFRFVSGYESVKK